MIEIHCSTCGGLFRLDEAMGGRKVRCSRCKSVLRIPEAGVFEPDTAVVEFADADPPLPPTTTAPGADGRPIVLDLATGTHQEAAVEREQWGSSTNPTRGFWADAAMSFVVHFRHNSPFAFGIVVILTVIRNFLSLAGPLGAIGQLIITGYFCAYWLNVIQHTCMGEDELPRFNIEEPWDGLIVPFMQFLAMWAWVALPAIAWSLVTLFHGPLLGEDTDRMVFRVLAIGAVFLWPMTILSVAVNGLSLGAVRYDLQLMTIGRNFPAYLAVFALLALAGSMIVGWRMLTGGSSVLSVILGNQSFAVFAMLAILAACIEAYVIIASMRIIGLFYRHNKQHFAWAAE